MIDFSNILGKFLKWRIKHIQNRQFLFILCILVGIAGGLAAVLLKNIVHYTQQLLTYKFDIEYENYLYLAYPLVGILLTVLFINTFIKDSLAHGVSKILYAISKKESEIKRHNTYSSMISSTLTAGFGGSIGLEAPIVFTGASIGSNIGQLMHMNYKTRTLLIGCGAAAALAGIFKAPIAAVIFSLEVLMIDLTTWSVIPLLISAVTGAVISNFLLGKGVVFFFTLKEPFTLVNFPFYILLGVITGLISVYFMRTTSRVEKAFGNIKDPYLKVLSGGIILGILIFIFPPLYGEGYDTMRNLLGGSPQALTNQSFFYVYRNDIWMFAFFLVSVLFLKVIAMAVTTGSGGIGGVFAPSLFIGGITGYVFAKLLNIFSFIKLSESNFSLVAMAGMIAGVMAAPLTAIFLIAEITGGYDLFIPLIITSAISFVTTKYFEPHSIYAKRLAQRGELITHNKDKAVLTLLKLNKIIETDFEPVNQNMTLGELVNVISRSNRNIFPVLDENESLIGIVLLDKIRHIIFEQDKYNSVYVKDIMILPPATLQEDEGMEQVLSKFENTGAWNLPVLSGSTYIGFISKSKIFSSYRRLLLHFSDE